MARSRFGLAALAALLTAAGTAGAATISPTVFTDDAIVNGNCTLREALEAADTNTAVDACPAGEAPPVVDRVVLGAGSYSLTVSSSVGVGEDLDLEGAGEASTDVSGTPTGLGLLRITGSPAPTVAISGITFHHSHSTNDGGCIDNRNGAVSVRDCTFHACTAADRGGALHNRGTLLLERATLYDNVADHGGAVDSFTGTTTVIDSIVVDNRSDPPTGTRQGGGINSDAGDLTLERTLVARNESALGGGVNVSASTVTLTDVTLDRNRATHGGGGLRLTGNGSDVTLTRTTVSHNQANRGGGIRKNNGVLRLDNSTVSGNAASEGGGHYGSGYGSGTSELTHATVAHNTARTGSAFAGSGAMAVANSLIAGDCAPGFGPVTTLGGNLESPGDTCGLTDPSDQTAVADPGITAVADHGGPTHTVLPLPGSPAIDAALALHCTATDQRGGPRPLDGDGVGGAGCDVGAVEVAQGEMAPLFEDGFEAGDTLAWTLSVP